MNRMRVAQSRDNWRALDKAELGHRQALNMSNIKLRLKKQTTFKRERLICVRTTLPVVIQLMTSFCMEFHKFSQTPLSFCRCVWRRICLTEEGRTCYRRFLDTGRRLNIICPRMERKFHNSAAMPDGTLRTAKAYKTSYITRGNVLMGRAAALFCQTETEELEEKEKHSDELKQ